MIREIAFLDDGTPYYVDDGEVLTIDDAFRAGAQYLPPVQQPITSEDEAEDLLARRADLEAQVRAERAKFEAIEKRHERRLLNLERRIDWWERNHLPALGHFARRNFKGKSRTLTLLNGRVSIRATPGRYRIVDPTAALEYVREHAPHLVRTREMPARIEDVEKASALTGETIDGVLEYVQPSEKIVVGTLIPERNPTPEAESE